MAFYEHTFLARQDITPQQVQALVTTYKAVIEEHGGKVDKIEYWGLKALAYKVKKNRRAHYSYFNIDAPHEAVIEMERQMRISTDIMRYLTVKVETLDEKPTAMMRKQDDRERGDRGDRGDRGGGDRGSRGPRREGGFGGDRGGFGGGGGGFGGRDRDGGGSGGFGGERPPREGGFGDRPPREGGNFEDRPRGRRNDEQAGGEQP